MAQLNLFHNNLNSCKGLVRRLTEVKCGSTSYKSHNHLSFVRIFLDSSKVVEYQYYGRVYVCAFGSITKISLRSWFLMMSRSPVRTCLHLSRENARLSEQDSTFISKENIGTKEEWMCQNKRNTGINGTNTWLKTRLSWRKFAWPNTMVFVLPYQSPPHIYFLNLHTLFTNVWNMQDSMYDSHYKTRQYLPYTKKNCIFNRWFNENKY